MPVCTINNNGAPSKSINEDDNNNIDYSIISTNDDTNINKGSNEMESGNIRKVASSSCPVSCSIEKRAYYKELQRWSKNMLLMIGLENVAKKFSDKKSWAKFYYCYPFVDQRQQKKPNNDASEDQGDNQPSCQVQSDSGMCSDWEPDEPCFICMGKGKQTPKSSENQNRQNMAKSLSSSSSSTTDDHSKRHKNLPSISATDHSHNHHHPHNHSRLSKNNQSSLIDFTKNSGGASATSLGLEYLFGSLLTNGQQQQQDAASGGDFTSTMAAGMTDPYQQAYYDLNRAYLHQLMLSWSKQMNNAYSIPSTSSTSPSTTTTTLSPSLLPYLTAAAAAATATASTSGAQRPQSMFLTSTSPQTLSSPDLTNLKSRSSTQGGSGASFSIQNLVLVDRPLSSAATTGPKIVKADQKMQQLMVAAAAVDEPLDLTIGGGGKLVGNGTENLQKSPDVCQTSSAAAVQNVNCPSTSNAANKKAYSQADLEAAVQDIRCGKLGTRRASVVYGIPRSTLRNKIYKLEATTTTPTMTSSSSLIAAVATTASAGNGDDSSSASGSGATNKKKRKRENVDSTLGGESSTLAAASDAVDRMMDDLTATVHRVASGTATPPPSAAPDAPTPADSASTAAAAARYNFRTAAALWSAANLNAAAAANGDEDEQRGGANALAAAAASIMSTFGILPENRQSSTSARDLNLPPNFLDTAATVVSLTALAEQLKLAAGGGGGGGEKLTSTILVQKKKMKTSSSSSAPPPRPSSTASVSSDGSTANNAAGGLDVASDKSDIGSDKKNRPKRGQYRRYDKSALAQAVLSVRKGEMSVHRAGSYYGVPHSTLEYKVKERNLLRPRKRDVLQQQKTAAAAAAASDLLKSPKSIEENSNSDSTPKNFDSQVE